MKRREALARLLGTAPAVSLAAAATPTPERPLQFVAPCCPRCGCAVMFMQRSKFVGDLVPVECGYCGWTGVSPVAR